MNCEVIKIKMKYDKIHLDVLIVHVCLLSTYALSGYRVDFLFIFFFRVEFMQSEV